MSSIVARRLRDPSDVLALAESHEPDSICLVGDVRERGLGRHVRAWAVQDGVSTLGVVTVARMVSDRWFANPLLFDERGAPAMGALIDRSRARGMVGGSRHVEPLVTHISRVRHTARMPFLVDSEKSTLPRRPADPRARLATIEDLEALVDLYASYELESIPTRSRLRRHLRATIRHRAIIAIEVDGPIVGAFRLECRGSSYDMWSGLTIRPEHRGEGLYWGIIDRLRRYAVEHDRLNCYAIAPINPVPLERQRQGLGTTPAQREWVAVALTPRRVWGEPRLRRAIELLEGPVQRRRSP